MGKKKVRRKGSTGDEEERLWELEQQDRDCGVSQEAGAWRLRESGSHDSGTTRTWKEADSTVLFCSGGSLEEGP